MTTIAYPEAELALKKAKLALMSNPSAVFFTTVCFSLRMQWEPGIPTAATDGSRIYFNPTFVLTLTPAETVFLLLHETLHVAFLHFCRVGTRDKKKWNYAGDYVINAELIKAGFTMPKGGLHDKKYDGMTVEQVYNVCEEPPQDFDCDLIPNPNGSANPNGTQTAEQQKSEVDQILVRAALQTKMAGISPGTIPGGLDIYIQSLTNPQMPWQHILRRFMTRVIKRDYTFQKLNRRFLPDYTLPTQSGEGMSSLAIAVDSSGSVNDAQFEEFLGEAHGILRDLKPEKIEFLLFDTAIKSVDTLRSVRDLKKVKFTGRGGTNINPVIDWAIENRPQVLLIFTDGGYSAPKRKPKCPVIWLINDNPDYVAPYGKTIQYHFKGA